MKQIEVSILGQSYVLGCPEGGETLLAVAVAAVDREMGAIRSAGKVRARERIAVLAALNLAYQLAERPVRETALKAAPARSDPAPEVDIETLIRRVDAALGSDGHLL